MRVIWMGGPDEVEPTLGGRRSQADINDDARIAAELDQADAAVRAALGLGHWPDPPSGS